VLSAAREFTAHLCQILVGGHRAILSEAADFNQMVGEIRENVAKLESANNPIRAAIEIARATSTIITWAKQIAHDAKVRATQ
jgi:hypothetical protein